MCRMHNHHHHRGPKGFTVDLRVSSSMKSVAQNFLILEIKGIMNALKKTDVKIGVCVCCLTVSNPAIRLLL